MLLHLYFALDKQSLSAVIQTKEGSLIVVLMGKGQFTDSGHFIVLYGLTGEGKVLLADPNSMERTNQEWDLETITKEAKSYAVAVVEIVASRILSR